MCCPAIPPCSACRYLQENQLAGQLPSSWGTAASWPVLRFLYLDSNPLTGTGGTAAMLACHTCHVTRPGSAAVSSFKGASLKAACIHQNSAISRCCLHCCSTAALCRPPHAPRLRAGTLPPEWGEQGSFPALKVLGLNGTLLTGGPQQQQRRLRQCCRAGSKQLPAARLARPPSWKGLLPAGSPSSSVKQLAACFKAGHPAAASCRRRHAAATVGSWRLCRGRRVVSGVGRAWPSSRRQRVPATALPCLHGRASSASAPAHACRQDYDA